MGLLDRANAIRNAKDAAAAAQERAYIDRYTESYRTILKWITELAAEFAQAARKRRLPTTRLGSYDLGGWHIQIDGEWYSGDHSGGWTRQVGVIVLPGGRWEWQSDPGIHDRKRPNLKRPDPRDAPGNLTQVLDRMIERGDSEVHEWLTSKFVSPLV